MNLKDIACTVQAYRKNPTAFNARMVAWDFFRFRQQLPHELKPIELAEALKISYRQAHRIISMIKEHFDSAPDMTDPFLSYVVKHDIPRHVLPAVQHDVPCHTDMTYPVIQHDVPCHVQHDVPCHTDMTYPVMSSYKGFKEKEKSQKEKEKTSSRMPAQEESSPGRRSPEDKAELDKAKALLGSNLDTEHLALQIGRTEHLPDIQALEGWRFRAAAEKQLRPELDANKRRSWKYYLAIARNLDESEKDPPPPRRSYHRQTGTDGGPPTVRMTAFQALQERQSRAIWEMDLSDYE